MTHNQELGTAGEALATQFLLNKGYLIVEKNRKTRYGEIDLLALDGDCLVIVEVKTKSNIRFGEPIEMIGHRKLMTLQRLVEIEAKRLNKVNYRIDAVCVMIEKGKEPVITYYESIGY